MAPPPPTPEAPGDLLTGRVVRLDAKQCFVDFDGTVRPCALRGRLFDELAPGTKNPVAVGDWVDAQTSGDDDNQDVIVRVHPRKNWLGRVASAHDPREQILFSNVDALFVVASLAKPGFSSMRTDRILVACEQHHIPAYLVLNKTDLVETDLVDDLRATYDAAGATVLETSAAPVDGGPARGLDALRALLVGKVSAFYGASGVGKSTLLNALEPGLALRVGKISKYWSAGKHTTTHSYLHRLALEEAGAPGWVIDTPGIRSFRPHGVTPAGLRDLFPEFAPYQRSCRFSGCTHDHEPDCAVYDALEEGLLAPTRYQSYVELLDELRGPSFADGE